MRTTPLVSVVIPAYNYARYIGETIDSLLSQTYPNLEIIVMDDGSSDNTGDVVARYGSKVAYYRQRNQGLSATRNNGFTHAAGEFVIFLDADDKLDPTYVAQTVECAQRYPESSFVYTQQQYFEASSKVTAFGPYSLERLKLANFIPACTLIRRVVLQRVKYDPSFTSWEDWDFYLSLAEEGHSGVLLDKPLVLYRKHADEKSMLDTFTQKARVRMLKKLRYKHWRLYGLAEMARFTVWYWRNK